MKQQIRVVAVDDHHLIRGGIRQALASSEEIEFVAEGECGSDIFPLLAKHQPDIIILDVSMPEETGMPGNYNIYTTIQKIVETYPKTRVLVVSQYIIEFAIRGAVEAGSRGYLDKSDILSFRNLPAILRNIYDGGVHFSESTIKAVTSEAPKGPYSLTRQQYRFLLSLTTQPAKLFHEIGDYMGVSKSTVKKYATAVNGNFKSAHVWHAIMLAVKFGMIPVHLIDDPNALIAQFEAVNFLSMK